jgi:hypothetical protein
MGELQPVSGGVGNKGILQAHLEVIVPVPKIPTATLLLAGEESRIGMG